MIELPAPLVLLVPFFLGRIAIWGWIEWRHPAYQVNQRAVLLADVITMAVLLLITIPLIDALYYRLSVQTWLPLHLGTWPLAVRVLLFIVLADLGHYWVHRLMHTPLLWRVHRWHHSPTHTGWLSGSRESVLDRLLVNFPYFFFTPVIGQAPWWVWTGLLFLAGLRNDWMHLNVRWGWRWLEWLFVTPRYHHIHHSLDTAHHASNLSVFFSCWDRLFGTHHDPEGTQGRLAFGTGEKVSRLRLFIGL